MEIKISVYSCAFNIIDCIKNNVYDFQSALENWSKYGDEIVIATPENETSDLVHIIAGIISDKSKNYSRVHIIPVEINMLEDQLSVGKLKNAALQNCNNELVIQQDLDERLGGYPNSWKRVGKSLLLNEVVKAVFIPVVDLFKDDKHYKSLGQKWYLHKKTGTYRAPVFFGIKEDGNIDTDKSDTCELVDKHNRLVPSVKLEFDLNDYPIFPIVFHYGHVDPTKRSAVNKFWSEMWSFRKGENVEIETDEKKLSEGEVKTLPFNIL